jgi:hypothetical protein
MKIPPRRTQKENTVMVSAVRCTDLSASLSVAKAVDEGRSDERSRTRCAVFNTAQGIGKISRKFMPREAFEKASTFFDFTPLRCAQLRCAQNDVVLKIVLSCIALRMTLHSGLRLE